MSELYETYLSEIQPNHILIHAVMTDPFTYAAPSVVAISNYALSFFSDKSSTVSDTFNACMGIYFISQLDKHIRGYLLNKVTTSPMRHLTMRTHYNLIFPTISALASLVVFEYTKSIVTLFSFQILTLSLPEPYAYFKG